MDWGQALTIIFGTAGFMGIFMLLVNKRIDGIDKRIDDLREDMNRRFEKVEEDIRELKQEIKEIRELLYKVLGAEAKKK